MVKNKGATAMKPFPFLRPLTACAALAALLSMSACSLSPITDPPVTSEATNATDTIASPDEYEALIAQLREEILLLKENDYIARAEYEARIAVLEAELAAIEKAPAGEDIPVSGDPEPPRETTADAPAQSAPAVAAFQYRVENGSAIIEAYTGSETHVTIPDRIGESPVTRVDDDAFRGTAVRSVVIPPSVTSIGWLAFADCASLLSVTVPASVTSIEYGAFDGCPLITIYCPKDSYASRYAAGFGLRQKPV